MPEQPMRTQKEIGLTYGGSSSKSFLDGRLDYTRRGHWLRRLRLIVFLLAAIGSVAFVFGYSRLVGPSARAKWNVEMKRSIDQSIAKGKKIRSPWNPEELFNTGPISENHSRLAAGCQACHWGSNPDVARLIGVGNAFENGVSDEQSTFGKLSAAWKRQGSKGMVGAYQKLTKLEQMDLACITCHVDYQQLPVHLHLPQAAQLHLAQVSFPFAVVGSGACSNCHKEHEEHAGERADRRAEVGSKTCASCHGKTGTTPGTSAVIDILKDPRRGRVAYPIGKTPAQRSMTMNLGEGLRRFLLWRAPGGVNRPQGVGTGFRSGRRRCWTTRSPATSYLPPDPARSGRRKGDGSLRKAGAFPSRCRPRGQIPRRTTIRSSAGIFRSRQPSSSAGTR